MSILEKINEINEDPENEKYYFGKINEIDIELGQINLDPKHKVTHPTLFKLFESDITDAIDQIYIAANAGDPRAKMIILAAAMHQVEEAGEKALAFPDLIHPTEDEIESLSHTLDCNESRSDGITSPTESLRFLDDSIAKIELALDTSRLEQ